MKISCQSLGVQNNAYVYCSLTHNLGGSGMLLDEFGYIEQTTGQAESDESETG